MKRLLVGLIASALLLGLGLFLPHSIFEVTLETPTPTIVASLFPQASPTPLPGVTEPPTALPDPTVIPAPTDVPTPPPDPYGELYFTIVTPKEYYPPATPPPDVDESTQRLVRLPGSCVVGLEACPTVEAVQTPFDMKDVWNEAPGMVWSPDGRYGLLILHPEDELSRGKTLEELEMLKTQDPSTFDISPSSVYLFDAQADTWREVYRAERKFFSSLRWSPDGQWIAFVVNTSVWAFHAPQADDGVYVIHPDGSALRQVSGMQAATTILGWIGNSIFLQRTQGLYPSADSRRYRMEMLTLEGEAKFLFESDRMAYYALSPDGGALLVADAQGESLGAPTKTVDILALDGSVLHTLGTFPNHTSSIYPLAWSPDGSRVAFANLRRAYVGPREGQGEGFPREVAGIPADGPVQEVYLADDAYTPPSFCNLQFSADNRYLLMDVYEGLPHFVTVSLESGQATPLEIPGMTASEQATFFSWRP